MFHGSIVALLTPMRQNGAVDYVCLRKLVDWHIAQGTDAIVVIGTTGEYYQGLWFNIGTPTELERLDEHLKQKSK